MNKFSKLTATALLGAVVLSSLSMAADVVVANTDDDDWPPAADAAWEARVFAKFPGLAGLASPNLIVKGEGCIIHNDEFNADQSASLDRVREDPTILQTWSNCDNGGPANFFYVARSADDIPTGFEPGVPHHYGETFAGNDISITWLIAG